MIDTIQLRLDFLSEVGAADNHHTGFIGLASEIAQVFSHDEFIEDIPKLEDLQNYFEYVLEKKYAYNVRTVYPFRFGRNNPYGFWWKFKNYNHNPQKKCTKIFCEYGNLQIIVQTSFFYDGTIDRDCIYIEGSLQKWYREYAERDYTDESKCAFSSDDIVRPLSFREVTEAFNLLGQQLGIEIKKATIRRLDFGINLSMNKHPDLYLNRLLQYKRQTRSFYGTSVYFGMNRPLRIAVYNKTGELKQKKHAYPSEIIPENLLRYEVRLTNKKRISDELGINPVVESLYDMDTYVKMADIVKNTYEEIVKERSLSYDLGEFTTLGGLGEMCISFVIRNIGLERLLNEVDFQAKNPDFPLKSPEQRSRIKQRFREINNMVTNLNNQGTDIIDELDHKVMEMCDIIRRVNDLRMSWPFAEL